MEKTFKSALTEMTASFIFVMTAAGVVCANAMTRGDIGWVGIALANCFVFMALLTFTTHISGGHVNPAVTVGHLVAGRVNSQTAVFYILAQLAGAIAAGLVTRAVFPNSVWQPVSLGLPDMANSVSPVSGTFIEALFTCVFVTVTIACMTDDRVPRNIAPLAVGCTLGFCTLVAGPLTGAGFNPARAFGSAIGSGAWAGQWPYWIGPAVGAVCAPFVYKALGGRISTNGIASLWNGPTSTHHEPKVTVRSVKR
jgi:MIP family channel proteins